MITLANEFLRGSYVPLVTPFRHGDVDYPAFSALVANQVENGSHGIVVAGTTGEAAALTAFERTRLLEVAVETAQRRLGVVASTGAGSFADTLALSQAAENAGADALLVIPPPYMRPPQRGLADYFIRLGNCIGLPFLINNDPRRTAVDLALETVEHIAEGTPNFVGIDHAVADFGFIAELLHRLGPTFRIFAGAEDLDFAMLAMGAAGVMNAVGNLAPRQIEQLYTLTTGGELRAARALYQQLAELSTAIYFDTNPIPLKYMLHKIGLLAHDEHRLPMVPPTAEVAQRLDAVLERAGLIDQVCG